MPLIYVLWLGYGNIMVYIDNIMKIIFSNHAEIKVKQRNLSKELINETLIAPDFIIPSNFNRERAYKKFRTQYLEVVFVKDGATTIVITAHWIAKFKKQKSII